jgi:hypothetical protein
MTALQSIDDLAKSWILRMQEIDFYTNFEFQNHKTGSISSYLLSICIDGCEPFWYAGASSDPANRASKHLSAIRNCSVTPNVGYSKLFAPAYFGQATSVTLHFSIMKTGLSRAQAEKEECVLSDKLLEKYGAAQVLTKPRKGRVRRSKSSS